MITGDTVIRISLRALADNLDAIRREVGQDTAVMAVVKSNGYGHGAVQIAPTLLSHGASYLAVSRLEEALPLRNALPHAPIILLGHTPDRLLECAVENNVALTIFTRRQAAILSRIADKLGRQACVHLKVETGFNRLGTDNVDELLDIIHTPGIYVEGIYSHLAQKDRASDNIQVLRFNNIVSSLENSGCFFHFKHLADSILMMDRPDLRFNMVRTGAALYGMRGFLSGKLDIRPVLTMETRISRIKAIHNGEGVGYDFAWIAERNSLIATLPFGYGDGYPRCLGGRAFVTIRGCRCPLVGTLCMDQCVADVTDVPGVREGDKAIIYGDGSGNTLSIAQAAEIADTNKNELLCRLTFRPARIYEDV